MTALSFRRYPVSTQGVEAFEELLGSVLATIRTTPGALWADAAKAFDDEPSYVVLSEWTAPADLDAWEAGAEHEAFEQAVDVHLRADPTSRRFTAEPH